ncbi:MAG: hypothetical protein V4547_09805 [Bacteroidota bacterium]
MIKNKNTSIIKIYFFIFFSILIELNQLSGQIVVEEEGKRLYYDRTQRITKLSDMKDMRDVVHKDKLLLGKNRIMGNISYNTGRILTGNPLGNGNGNGHKTHYEIRSALGFYTRIRFFEEFSFNSTFYIDYNKAASARWTSNYTYSIGRYNWRPNKYNYGYENYLNNRYSDNIQKMGDKFLEGYYFVSYSHNLSDKLIQYIKLDETTNIKFTYFSRYAIKYRDPNDVVHGGLTSGKLTLGGGFRYTIYKRIYVETALYLYPEGELKKQPWDPDYTYGFGYFDWRSFRISLTYGNWAVNRFSWNKKYYPDYGFQDGNFRIAANWIW